MKRTFLLLGLLFTFGLSFAQTKDSLSVEEQERRKRNIEAGNPFKKFGYTPKIATLSKGKYLEWHDLDSIVRIGSFSYHVKKKDITGYYADEDKNSESTLRPELTSRWMSPDPLAEEFPSWSPYNFTMNNPIRFIDPDGRAPFDIIDIDINSGSVNVTPAKGNDVVRFVDKKGGVKDSYNYGKNGSFKEDFSAGKTTGKVSNATDVPITALSTNNIKQAGKLFERISQNSNIEWEYLNFTDSSGKGSDFVSIGNTGSFFDDDNFSGVAFSSWYINELGEGIIENGYRLSVHEHNHPGGTQPSGYKQDGYPNFQDYIGDISSSISIRRHPISTRDIEFYVNPRGKDFKYKYDGKGINNFEIVKKK